MFSLELKKTATLSPPPKTGHNHRGLTHTPHHHAHRKGTAPIPVHISSGGRGWKSHYYHSHFIALHISCWCGCSFYGYWNLYHPAFGTCVSVPGIFRKAADFFCQSGWIKFIPLFSSLPSIRSLSYAGFSDKTESASRRTVRQKKKGFLVATGFNI